MFRQHQTIQYTQQKHYPEHRGSGWNYGLYTKHDRYNSRVLGGTNKLGELRLDGLLTGSHSIVMVWYHRVFYQEVISRKQVDQNVTTLPKLLQPGGPVCCISTKNTSFHTKHVLLIERLHYDVWGHKGGLENLFKKKKNKLPLNHRWSQL